MSGFVHQTIYSSTGTRTRLKVAAIPTELVAMIKLEGEEKRFRKLKPNALAD